MITPEGLATTVDTLYSMLHQWDADSPEFSTLESALTITAHSLQVVGQIPVRATLRELSFSEVCCHMQVEGKLMWVEPLENDMAQLYTLDGRQFSFPITKGEAGLHFDELEIYGGG